MKNNNIFFKRLSLLLIFSLLFSTAIPSLTFANVQLPTVSNIRTDVEIFGPVLKFDPPSELGDIEYFLVSFSSDNGNSWSKEYYESIRNSEPKVQFEFIALNLDATTTFNKARVESKSSTVDDSKLIEDINYTINVNGEAPEFKVWKNPNQTYTIELMSPVEHGAIYMVEAVKERKSIRYDLGNQKFLFNETPENFDNDEFILRKVSSNYTSNQLTITEKSVGVKPVPIQHVADISALNNSITAATLNIDSVSISKDGTNVPSTSYWVNSTVYSEYVNALNAAKEMLLNYSASQIEVDQVIENLELSTQAFNQAKLLGSNVSPYNLVLKGENITTTPSALKLTAGDSVTITVTPPSGKQVSSFTVNGSNKKNELLSGVKYQYTFIVSEKNNEVIVTYENISSGGSSSGGSSSSSGSSGGGTNTPAKPTETKQNTPTQSQSQTIPGARQIGQGDIKLTKFDKITAENIKQINGFFVPANKIAEGTSLPSDIKAVVVEGKKPAFKDVSTHWAASSINEAVERGLLNGMSETSFQPKAPLTAEQTFAGLSNVLIKNNILNVKIDKDIIKDKLSAQFDNPTWSTLSVAQVLANTNPGMVDRYSDPKSIKEKITRGEMAKIIYYLGVDVFPSNSNDPEEFCKELGIMVGDANGNFASERVLSRAELSSILLRIDDKLSKL